MISTQCCQGTVRLNVLNSHGSGFTVNRHERQWLITARHLVKDVAVSDIQVVRHENPILVNLEIVPETGSGADVAVFLLSAEITPNLNLNPTSTGVVYSQDVYFLGFPYDLDLQTNGVTFPFVKKAILSAFKTDLNGVTIWFLDGINNPGFSGGPVLFRNVGTQEWHVAAVVTGYLHENVQVQKTAGIVSVNTGIILAHDIRHAIESIDAFVEI